MAGKIRERLPRLVLTLLLSFGLLSPLLGALNLGSRFWSCLPLCMFLAAGLEALTFSRRASVLGGFGLGLAVLILLLGRLGALQDVLLALSLHLSGVSGALPLVGSDAARLLAFLVTLLAFFSTRKAAGCLGAVLMTVGAALMLWLADRPDLMLPLLPAGIAALSLYLLDRPGEASPIRIIPWAAALILLAFLLTPSAGLVDPTLKKKADEIRQNVMDRLFFTEPRDVFSLSSEGYYPQGISQLGGPVSPTDHPVMQVSTPKTVYLRGVMLNAYDGRSWRNTLGGRRYLWDASGMIARRSLLFDQALPSPGLSAAQTEAMEVSVRMLGSGASTIFTPQRVRSLRAGGDLVPYFSNASELFVTRNLQAGDTWSVSAPLFMAGDPGLSVLVEAAAADVDPQYESVRETYTALPTHLEEPVWQLAADITASCDTPYEKAFALQTWLSRNYRYRLDVAYQPPELDFVTNFLFNTREGYCTYFASAMTVLCRMAGLPARYVEGYIAAPNANGEALVTGLDAHAWTEVYFNGFGWLTFDATPRQAGSGTGSGSSDSAAPGDTPNPEETPTPSPAPDATPEAPTPTPPPDPDSPASEDTPTPDPENSPPPGEEADPVQAGIPWLPLLILLLALLLFARWRLTDPALLEKRLPEEGEKFDLWLNDVISRLAAMNQTRKAGETPMSFTRRLDREKKSPVPLGTLGECASLLHYGKVHAQPTDTELARNVSLALKKAMRPSEKWKYAIHRLLPAVIRVRTSASK